MSIAPEELPGTGSNDANATNYANSDEAKFIQRLTEATGESADYSSMIKLANMYKKGIGCKRDIDSAIIWYNIAVEKGSTDAMFSLAALHGERSDYISAISMYKKYYACQQQGSNHSQCADLIAETYLNIGNPARAIKWAERSLSQTVKRSQKSSYVLLVAYFALKQYTTSLMNFMRWMRNSSVSPTTK